MLLWLSCAGHGGHHGGFHHDFSDAEGWAQRFEDPERAQWQQPEAVVDLMGIEPGMKVADVGAGTGYFLPHLVEAVGPEGRVVGLDVEPAMVDYMASRITESGWPQAEARLSAPDDPGLAAESTDRILIVNTWHHIGDRGRYAARLLNGLREGGAVYVVDFDLDAPRGPPRRHRLAPEQVVRELAEGGLEAEVLAESLPLQYIVVGRRPR
ncbi:MAG: methyltransferase domain-containing protein [Myxococcota bacterium]|nr:methyltransferase domain-containing protein [Myxococcota bacterium]